MTFKSGMHILFNALHIVTVECTHAAISANNYVSITCKTECVSITHNTSNAKSHQRAGIGKLNNSWLIVAQYITIRSCSSNRFSDDSGVSDHMLDRDLLDM